MSPGRRVEDADGFLGRGTERDADEAQRALELFGENGRAKG